MSELMHLVVHPAMQHVLAAALTVEGGTPPPDANSLIGEHLLFRNPETGAVEATVAAANLQVQTMAAREDVLMTARRFQLVDGLPEPKDDDAQVTTLDGNDITVKLQSPAPKDETVWVQVEGDTLVDPVVHRVNVAETATAGTEPLPLPNGDYRLLVLAHRHRATVVHASVP